MRIVINVTDIQVITVSYIIAQVTCIYTTISLSAPNVLGQVVLLSINFMVWSFSVLILKILQESIKHKSWELR